MQRSVPSHGPSFSTPLLALAVVAAIAAPAVAQVPSLTLDDVVGPPQSEPTVVVLLSTPFAASGFSFGVCHDPADLSALGVSMTSTLSTVNGGSEPDFFQGEILANGVTAGCVVDFVSAHQIPAGDTALITIDYSMTLPVGNSTPLDFCTSLGVETIIATPTGAQVVPDQFSGSVTSDIIGPVFEFSLADETIDFDPATGVEVFTAAASITEQPVSPGSPNPVHGFSMAVRHDPTFLEVTDVVPAPFLAAVNAGAGPDFFEANFLDDGFTLGAVLSFGAPGSTLTFVTPQEAVLVEYTTLVTELQGQLTPVGTVLDWRNGIGSPPISNTIVYSNAGDTTLAILDDAQLTLNPVAELFVRGDCTGNGVYDIGDPIGLIGSLFSGAPAPACEDACDGNDDGALNLADPIYLLAHLFAGGPPPSAPYPNCNGDPTADPLDCATFPGCP